MNDLQLIDTWKERRHNRYRTILTILTGKEPIHVLILFGYLRKLERQLFLLQLRIVYVQIMLWEILWN